MINLGYKEKSFSCKIKLPVNKQPKYFQKVLSISSKMRSLNKTTIKLSTENNVSNIRYWVDTDVFQSHWSQQIVFDCIGTISISKEHLENEKGIFMEHSKERDLSK